MRKVMQSSLYQATVTSLFLATAAVAQTAAEGSIQLVGVAAYPTATSASLVAAPQTLDDRVRAVPLTNPKAALAKTSAAAPAVPLTNPDPTPKAVVRPGDDFTGFPALTHFDSMTASNGTSRCLASSAA